VIDLETQARERDYLSRTDPWEFEFPSLGECEAPYPLPSIVEEPLTPIENEALIAQVVPPEVVQIFMPPVVQDYVKSEEDSVQGEVPIVQAPQEPLLAPLVIEDEGKVACMFTCV